MFTGIVEETGRIEKINRTAKGIELSVRAKICGQDIKLGDSLSVNGCCLTVVKKTSVKGEKILRLDLLKETWERTNLQFVKPGAHVNLERSLQVGARLGGHFVTGHVDGLGKIIRWEKAGADYVLDISATPEVMRYLVFKGSITVDGISLTIAKVSKKSFRVWIIPHTSKVTVLRERAVGDFVNLEADILGKYVYQFSCSS